MGGQGETPAAKRRSGASPAPREEVLCDALCHQAPPPSWLFQLSSIAIYTRISLVCVIPGTYPGPPRPLRENFPAGLVLLDGSSLIMPLHHKTQQKDLPWLAKPSFTRLSWPLVSMLANERVKPRFTRGLGVGSSSGCLTRLAQGTPAELDLFPMTPSPPSLLGCCPFSEHPLSLSVLQGVPDSPRCLTKAGSLVCVWSFSPSRIMVREELSLSAWQGGVSLPVI